MLSRKTSLIVFVLLIAAAITSVMIYRSQAEATRQEQAFVADKARFAKVEVEMAEAYAAIVTAVGKPDFKRTSNGCGRTDIKFDHGAIFCSTSYIFAYNEKDIESTYLRTKAMQSAIEENGSFKIYPTRTAENINRTNNSQQNLQLSLGNIQSLTCDLYLSFGKTFYLNQIENISSEYASEYMLRCTKGMQKEIYPLAE